MVMECSASTIGHGLGAAKPAMVIKNTEHYEWAVYHKSLGHGKSFIFKYYMHLINN